MLTEPGPAMTIPRVPLIVLLCVTVLGNTFALGCFPALLPELGRAGGLPDWQLGLLAGLFGLARMLADVPAGLFITHHLRRAIVVGPCILAAGVLCLGAGGPFPVLVAGRVLMGLGHTLSMLGGLTAILRHQPAGRLTASLNAFELSAMIGMLGGLAVLGALPARLGWNVAFVVTSAPQLLGFLVLPLTLAALPAAPAPSGAPLFARAPSRPGGIEPISFPGGVAFVAGGVAAVTYATVEQFLIPVRGSRELGLDRGGIAGLLMVSQLFDAAALLPVGILSDRREPGRVLGVVLLVLALATLCIAFGDLPVLLTGCALFGLGMAGWMLPLSVLRRETPAEQIAWRTALYRVGVDAGLFLGPFLSGLLTGRLAGLLPATLAAALVVTGLLVLRHPRRAPARLTPEDAAP
jgi:MFS family permease